MLSKNASFDPDDLVGAYLPPFLLSGALPPLFCIRALIPLINFLVWGDSDVESNDSQIFKTSSGFF